MNEEQLLKTSDLDVNGKLLRYWVRHRIVVPTLRVADGSWRWSNAAAENVNRVKAAWEAKEAARRELDRDRVAVTV
jgi:hypothetical protein